MTNIKRAFWGYLLLLGGLWWLADQTDWASLAGIFEWRKVLSQGTGMIGIGVMSLAMILAARPAFFERHLGGLDKMYRLHKWLGISALAVSVTHWLIANAPKWLVNLGLLERRKRGPRPAIVDDAIRQFFADRHGLAEGIGEWMFYVAVLLLVLALVKRFPYRRFFQTHRLLPLVYLGLVFHSIILLKFEYWTTPLGFALAGLMLAGSVAAVMALLRRRAGGARVAGKVLAVDYQEKLDVLAVEIGLDGAWPGHQAGQFAFVTFHRDEGAHPYTITSSWNGDGRIRFLIKALGDYTRTLPDRLQAGDAVAVEGPHGGFTFAGEAPRQIWIGGGIGITPFIARMQALARQHDGKPVDLFHSTATYDPQVIERLGNDAAAANVDLHVLWDVRDGRLDLAHIMKTVPDWRDADVWFCGPAKFGRSLKDGLAALGFPEGRFHQELFEML